MNDIIKQFKVVFGVDNKPLNDGLKQSENSLKSFGKVFGGIVSAYFSYSIFKEITQGFAEFNSQLSNSLSLVGGNVENITALGGALKRFGGGTEDVINSMKSLNNNLEASRYGGGALIEVARKYGVAFHPLSNAEDTLISLTKQMKNYSRQTRVAIANQLGLSESLAVAFANGNDLQKLINKQKELGTITEHDLKISNEYTYAILDLKDMFGALIRDISRLVLPIFIKIINLFYDFIAFIRKHKQLVIAFFAGLAIALSPLLVILRKIALANIKAFAPFYAVIAVITAIALIIEDLYFYFNGWNSVTGQIVDKFPAIKVILEAIKPLVMGIFEIFNKILDFLKEPSWNSFLDIFKTAGHYIKEFILKAFELVINTLDNLINKFPILKVALEPIKIIVDSIKDAFVWISELISNFNLDAVYNQLSDFKDSIKDFGSNMLDKANPFNWFKDDKEINNLQVPSIPSNISNANTYNINNNINQNISSATPLQLANETNGYLINSINAQRQQIGAL